MLDIRLLLIIRGAVSRIVQARRKELVGVLRTCNISGQGFFKF